MAAGPVLTGDNGSFLFTPSGGAETELEIGKWTFNAEVDTQRYASSKSGGYKKTEPGNKHASGTAEGKRVTDTGKVEAVLTGLGVGVKGTAKLMFDDNTGISVPCVVKSLSNEVDVDGGTIESFSLAFESDGAWSYI